MSVPPGVDANAANIYSATISIKAGRAANVRVFTRLVIQNSNSQPVSVNVYVAIDGQLIRALPLVYGASSQLCQEFTGRALGLASGDHTLQVYIGTSAPSGVNWVTVDADWDIFYA